MVPDQLARSRGFAYAIANASRGTHGLSCPRSDHSPGQSRRPLLLVGLLYAAMLPMLPRHPAFWGGSRPHHVDGPDLGFSRRDQSDVESPYRLALVHRLTGGIWYDGRFCRLPVQNASRRCRPGRWQHELVWRRRKWIPNRNRHYEGQERSHCGAGRSDCLGPGAWL